MDDANKQLETAFAVIERPFYCMGRPFVYRHIPAMYFQEILLAIAKVQLGIEQVGTEIAVKPGMEKSLADLAGEVISRSVYEILRDILKYQNAYETDTHTLRMNMSALEYAYFIAIIGNDRELQSALGVVNSGLGKNLDVILNGLSQTARSTRSLSLSLESPPSNSTDTTQSDKSGNSSTASQASTDGAGEEASKAPQAKKQVKSRAERRKEARKGYH